MRACRRITVGACGATWLGALVAALAIWGAAAGAIAGGPVAEDLSDPASVLSEASVAYDRGVQALAIGREAALPMLERSIALYQRIIEDPPRGLGIQSGALWYNLGGAYLLAGDTGRAVLAYKRAERLAPLDRNVQTNLAIARQRAGAAAGGGGESRPIFESVVAWVQVIPGSIRFEVFAGAFGAAWLASLWRLVAGAGRLRPGRGVVIAAACVAAGALATLLADEAWARAVREAVVIAPEVIGRTGPDDATYEASPGAALKGGAEARLVKRQASWAQIRLGDGRETWVPGSSIEEMEPR